MISYIPSQHPEGCQKCKLGCQENVAVVHSVLPSHGKILFIGEAPGLEETSHRMPFLGPTGQLLNQTLEIVGIRREDIGITNVVACKPPENRVPSKKEISSCAEFLDKEILEYKPSIIVTLGTTALKWALPTSGTITNSRGKFFQHPKYDCFVFPTFHPAYILRNIFEKSTFVRDFQVISYFLQGKNVAPEQRKKQYFYVRNKVQLDWLVDNLHKNELWASDLETTSLDPLIAEIFMFIFSWKEDTAVTVDIRDFSSKEDYSYLLTKMKEVYENGSKKVFHNGGYDIQCLYKCKIYVDNYYGETMLMHHLLDENNNHDLGVLAAEFTEMGGYDAPLAEYKKQNKINSYKDIPRDIIELYGAKDGDVTLRSYNAMLPKIQSQGLDWLFHNITLPSQKVLAMTEYKGVSVDIPYLKSVQRKYSSKMEDAMRAVREISQVKEYEMFKKDQVVNELRNYWANSKMLSKKYSTFMDYVNFRKVKNPDIIDFQLNINSSLQLRELLIERMGLKVIKATNAGAPSMDGDVLEEYAKSNKFCERLLEYRTLSHLKGTFLDGIESRLSIVDCRAHTDYLLHGTGTGRPSSRNPNLNNIPRTGTAEDIKDIFCADRKEGTPNGWGDWIMEADLGQAEFRFWIQYSQDPQALYDLRMGIDIHKLMAAAGKGRVIPKGNITKEIYWELVKDITKQERHGAKLVVFGVMYGRGAESVAKQLGISVAQAQTIIDQFFSRYSLARQYLINTVAHARREGYVVNFFGRRRRLLDILSEDDMRRSESERQAYNSTIQGGASDLLLHTMVRIVKQLWANQMKTRVILTVYDSIIFNIPDDELQDVTKLVDYEMSNHPFKEITVPIIAEIKVGSHWGSTMEIDPKADWGETYQKLLENEKREDLRWRNAV